MRYLGALLPSLVPPVEVPRVFKSRTPPVPAPMAVPLIPLAGPVHFGAALLRGQANPLTVDHDEGVVDLLEVEGVKLRCGCLY